MTAPVYIHGTSPDEQGRLARMQRLLEDSSLAGLALRAGERVLDVGAGLGHLARAMARAVGPEGIVVAVEADAEQLAGAARAAGAEPAAPALQLRPGRAPALPLHEHEWGSFDVAHARFLLEHVADPQAVVAAMARALRPGGRLVLEDDDHAGLRLWPPVPQVEAAWAAYVEGWRRCGYDPFVGRRLSALLVAAGVRPVRADMPFFGACAGEPRFELVLANFAGVLGGARATLREVGALDEGELDAALAAFDAWGRRPDAVLWYTTCRVQGRTP